MIDAALLIGRTEGMEETVSLLLPRARCVRYFHSSEDAVAAGVTVPLAVVLQHWSDEFAPDEVLQLLAACTLTRLIVCQGPWCASDGRTRQVWPAAVCVPASGFAARLEREISVIAGRVRPLPWTAGLDEIFAFDHGE